MGVTSLIKSYYSQLLSLVLLMGNLAEETLAIHDHLLNFTSTKVSLYKVCDLDTSGMK